MKQTCNTHPLSGCRDRMIVGFIMLSPLSLWVQILLMVRCTRYNFMW